MLSKQDEDALRNMSKEDVLDYYREIDEQMHEDDIIEYLTDEWRRRSFADFNFRKLFNAMGVNVWS